MKILKICVHLDFRNGTHDWEPNMYIVHSTLI